MARKDITDLQVCLAVAESDSNRKHKLANMESGPPYLSTHIDEILNLMTDQPIKVCYRALERAYSRGLVDYGVGLYIGWLTDAGKQLLAAAGEKSFPQSATTDSVQPEKPQ